MIKNTLFWLFGLAYCAVCGLALLVLLVWWFSWDLLTARLFACGKDKWEGLMMAAVTNFSGVIYGWLMQLIAVQLGGGLGYTIGVGLLVAAIIMTGKIKWASFIPGMFVGCFTFFGFSGTTNSTDYLQDVLPALIASLVAGALLGMVYSWSAEAIGKALIKDQPKVSKS